MKLKIKFQIERKMKCYTENFEKLKLMNNKHTVGCDARLVGTGICCC